MASAPLAEIGEDNESQALRRRAYDADSSHRCGIRASSDIIRIPDRLPHRMAVVLFRGEG